ncbi:rubrerythrin family protein [Halorussus marinus]|uniref:rubrerythrin family protein n=1 Tax=Halorussus marinus TaxID=2505976 RepID=UPI00106ED8C1|nr:rubrerythrin family protein [Halorussus marinus]
MDAAAFPEEIEARTATELDRLGSQQAVVALTDADLDAESVLRAAARSERTAAETFAAWAEAETDEAASRTFAELVDRERDHYDRVVAELEDAEHADGLDPMHERLRDLETTVERAAGLVGRSLVGDRTQLQVVNFFVNEADERRADLFRELRADTKAGVETGADLLAARCEEGDWDRALAVAESVVEVAYDDYAETLTGMGLDPKPLC